MFQKILIANRGEIACRVMRTANRMGISTVAVYSEADQHSLHTRLADEAVLIGPANASQSYLNIDAIINACQITGADAVHPGYGFLSEDTEFCKRLEDNDITFIGPSAAAIAAMGDKITSKKIARAARVSVVPGYDDVIQNEKHAVELARKIGYPVMLKPTSAGGGKGMRLAYNDSECAEGFLRSVSESKAHFDDDRVFVEKYIQNPRHIEVQILADKTGHTIHLGERECSLQRRHQKVIEEAPSPFLSDKARNRITRQAVALAHAVNYVTAGTIEFVVDADQNFYFLEMNTRLQVEHPVTELVTGIDLVEWMIRIAANEKLTLDQSDVRTSGWAVESRIYAEDPARNFLPSTGRLNRFRPPVESDYVRVDTGVSEGGEVSMFYDPMIAKLVTYGSCRAEAMSSMAMALDEFQISGVTSNLHFLQRIIRHSEVLDGNMTTGFIEQEFPQGYNSKEDTSEDTNVAAMIATIAHYSRESLSAHLSGQLNTRNWTATTDWVAIANGKQFGLSIEKISGGHQLNFKSGDEYFIKHSWKLGQSLFYFSLNGENFCAQVRQNGIGWQIDYFGRSVEFKIFTPQAARYNRFMLKKNTARATPFLKSPMPGLLVELRVEAGEEVQIGDPVAIIEAMKMENTLRSERTGVIHKILADVGDSLAADQPILEFSAEEE